MNGTSLALDEKGSRQPDRSREENSHPVKNRAERLQELTAVGHGIAGNKENQEREETHVKRRLASLDLDDHVPTDDGEERS